MQNSNLPVAFKEKITNEIKIYIKQLADAGVSREDIRKASVVYLKTLMSQYENSPSPGQNLSPPVSTPPIVSTTPNTATVPTDLDHPLKIPTSVTSQIIQSEGSKDKD